MKNITIDQANEIWNDIQKSQKVLLHCHPSPDGDSIGSALSFYHALKNLDKEVTVIKGDSDLPFYLRELPGYESITKKNFFEVNLSDYDLFIIVDSGSLNQISKIGDVVLPEKLNTIAIDHHASNTGFTKLNLIDISYPSTTQIIYDLFKTWGIAITQDIALNLFIGMYTDTGGFKYRPVSYKTLAAAADLAEIAPNYPDLIFSMENSNTKTRLILQGLFLTSIETFFQDSVVIASVSFEDLAKNGISEDDVSGSEIANILKSVIGWNIGISLIEKEPGIIKVSMRSRDVGKFDLSKVSTHLGGGGHRAAAGVQLKGTISEAKKTIVSALSQLYPDLKS